MNAIFWLGFSIFIGIVIFNTISSQASFNLPYKSYLIQSGSMEPAIMTGDVVLVKKDNYYKKGDVATFYDYEKRVVTHRIIEELKGSSGGDFITKGDANQAQDLHELDESNIIGKVVLTIPKLGYLLAFSRTKIGIAILILIPAVIIIYDEFGKLKKEVG